MSPLSSMIAREETRTPARNGHRRHATKDKDYEAKLNDPIRMYFSQAATIPLLTREEEIALATAIHSARARLCELLFSTRYAQEKFVEMSRLVLDKALALEHAFDANLNQQGARQKFVAELRTVVSGIERNLKTSGKDLDRLRRADRLSASRRSEIQTRVSRAMSRNLKRILNYSVRAPFLQRWKDHLLRIADAIQLGRRLEPGFPALADEALGASGDGGAREKERLAFLNKSVEIDRAFRQLKEAQDRLAGGNLRLVISIARRYRNNGLAFLDLIQEGNLGLLRATEKYDPEKGVKFGTYATWWIRQAVSRALEEKARMIRLPSYLSLALGQEKRHKLDPTGGPGPVTDVPADELKRARRLSKPPVSLSALASETEETPIGDLLPDSSTDAPGSELERKDVQAEIGRALEQLSSRHRDVLRWRYGIGTGAPLTYEEIGKKFRVCRERIRQMELEALKSLRTPDLRLGELLS